MINMISIEPTNIREIDNVNECIVEKECVSARDDKMVTLQCDERDVGPTRGCVGWTSKRNDQSVREKV